MIPFLNICLLSRVLAPLPTKLWSKLFIQKKLPRTAWQAATSHLVKPHKTQDLALIVLKRSLLWQNLIRQEKMFLLLSFYIFLLFPPSFRWLSQKDKLQASLLACVTHNTSIAHCKCRMFFSYCRRLKVITYFSWKNHTTVANKAQVPNRPRMIKHISRPCFLYSLFFCIINAISI